MAIAAKKSEIPEKQSAKELAVLVLAAGKGSRMKSALPKVLHPIAGLPMVQHIIQTAEALNPKKIIVVLSPGMDDVAAVVSPHAVAIQQQPKGTGDAVRAALPMLEGFQGRVLVLYGDVPLTRPDTLGHLLAHHDQGDDFGATFLAMAPPNPTGYGRIFQNPDGTLNRIVEEADATADEKLVRLCNSGLMVLEGEGITERIEKIGSQNSQGEFYLVDIAKILAAEGVATGVTRGDYAELRGVNSRAQLAELEMAWQHRKRLDVMENGTTLEDPSTVYFSYDTKIGTDTTIGPSVVFGPNVVVEDNVHIHPFCHIEGAVIKSNSSIGPFARLRPGTEIGSHAKIGNFVEVKNSKIGEGAKANHLGYIGDAQLGAHSNFGCGAITVNYDGKKKSKTVIGDHVMIGSNSSLIAPIEIEDGAYVAAGSTITHKVPKEALAIGRARQVNKEGLAAGRLKKE